MKVDYTTWAAHNTVFGQASTNLNEQDMAVLTLALPTAVRRVKLRMTCENDEWRTFMHVFPRERPAGSFGDITLTTKGTTLKPTKRTNPLASQVHALCAGLDAQLLTMETALRQKMAPMRAQLEASA